MLESPVAKQMIAVDSEAPTLSELLALPTATAASVDVNNMPHVPPAIGVIPAQPDINTTTTHANATDAIMFFIAVLLLFALATGAIPFAEF
jgi:hypothetical protein